MATAASSPRILLLTRSLGRPSSWMTGGQYLRTVTSLSHSAAEEVKPFEEIPGPKGLPLLGTLIDNIRFSGESHLMIRRRFDEYGPIYKETIGGFNIVYLSDTRSIEKLCRNEGKYPKRISVEPWREWREEAKLEKGILISNGPEWKRMRSIVDKRMLRPHHVTTYTNNFNDVITDFIDHLVRMRDSKGGGVTVPNMESQLFRWSLETIGTVLYETRFGGFDEGKSSENKEFIDAVQEVFRATERLFFMPRKLARFVLPKYYKMHENGWRTVFDKGSELIDAKVKEIDSRVQAGEEVEGFLAHLLTSQKLSRGEVIANVSELMFGAVDTTSNTMQWVIHHVAEKPEVQQRLQEEIHEVTGGKIPGMEELNQMPYTKAIIKETLRLYPIAGVHARELDQDIVLSGYNIPKGINILSSTYCTQRDPALFPDPNEFKPERWLRNENKSLHTFAYLPFGFGPKMCIGRRVAELEMHLLLIRLSQRFQLEPLTGEKLELVARGLLVPEHSVEVKFIDRT